MLLLASEFQTLANFRDCGFEIWMSYFTLVNVYVDLVVFTRIAGTL